MQRRAKKADKRDEKTAYSGLGRPAAESRPLAGDARVDSRQRSLWNIAVLLLGLILARNRLSFRIKDNSDNPDKDRDGKTRKQVDKERKKKQWKGCNQVVVMI